MFAMHCAYNNNNKILKWGNMTKKTFYIFY